MRTLLFALTAAALGVSSAFLVACGDRNDLIPRNDASAIVSDLDRASTLYSQEECRAAQAAVGSAESRASRLPSKVNSDLRATLAENLQTVLDEIRQQCGKTQTTQSTQTTATTPTTTVTTPTTDTTPTTTTTAPPPTTTTTTPPPTTPTNSGGNGGSGDSGGTPSGQGLRLRGKGKHKYGNQGGAEG
jgi:hypothetical protein